MILGVTALVSIVASMAASTTALVQQVRVADRANNLSKNVSLALVTQENIEKLLMGKVNVLKEAILYMGTLIQNIKVKLTVSCYATDKWICVTPLPCNGTGFTWKQIQVHIKGIWNSSDLDINSHDSHHQISNISHAHLRMCSLEGIATSFLSAIQSCVSAGDLGFLLLIWALQ